MKTANTTLSQCANLSPHQCQSVCLAANVILPSRINACCDQYTYLMISSETKLVVLQVKI